MRPAWIWSRKSVSGATDIWNKTVWSLAPVRFGTPLKSLDERRFESALLRNNPLGMEPVGYHTVIRRRRALFDFVDKDTAERDPLQTVQPSSNNRVRRGGGFGNDYRYGNTSWRTSVSYTSTGYDNGYRMVSAAIAY